MVVEWLTGCAADAALTAKLQEEIQYEKEAAAEVAGEPEFLKAFKAQGIWTVCRVLGCMYALAPTKTRLGCTD